jgi:hypothetical protein
MIQFMVIGAPRSGTAWAAEWLGAVHDPLWDRFYLDLDELSGGISCTGLGMFPWWVNQHPARKVILHREPRDVNASLNRLNCGSCPPEVFEGLAKIEGMHVPWTDLWDKPQPIWEHLIGFGFDERRHTLLKTVNIQTDDWKWRKTPERVRRRYAQIGVIVTR